MKLVSVLIEEFKGDQGIDILKEIYPGLEEVKRQRERYLRALETFRKLYGDKEAEIYSVPGRSEVCGNHTDHQRGEVLASAVSLDMLAVVSPQAGVVKLVSDGYDMKPVSLDELEKRQTEEGTSEGLVRGVLARCRELGYRIGGFEGFLTSEVMQGSGLSSSAAFEVMIGTVVSGLYNEMQMDPVVIAQIGQYSENVYFGKPSGLMDQSACSVGSLIHIDFADAENPKVEKIEVDFSEFHHSLCIVDVHASHADLTQEYAAIPQEMKAVAKILGKEVLEEVEEEKFYGNLNQIREELGNDRALLRAIHLFEENKRVRRATEALKKKEFSEFRRVVQESGNSSFKYLQNIYAAHDEKNQAVALALAVSEQLLGTHGVCRVHGGGFAGTIQAFVEEAYVADYKCGMEKVFGEGSCHVLGIRKQGGVKVR